MVTPVNAGSRAVSINCTVVAGQRLSADSVRTAIALKLHHGVRDGLCGIRHVLRAGGTVIAKYASLASLMRSV